MDSLEEKLYASVRPLNTRPCNQTRHDKIPPSKNMTIWKVQSKDCWRT